MIRRGGLCLYRNCGIGGPPGADGRNFGEASEFDVRAVSIKTEISCQASVWRLRDEQTVLSAAQERHLVRVAADDGRAKVIGWNFSHAGPVVVRGCGDWGVINRRGCWVHISRRAR
jgi:hypothetical protein